MPTYDYRCKSCGHQFELFQQMTAPVKRKCHVCKENKLERLIGIGAGVLFKGGGFYETEYRSEGYKKDAKKEKESISSSSEKSKDSSKKKNKKTAVENKKNPSKPSSGSSS